MTERRCLHRSTCLEGRRRHARFCSGACRAAASSERQAHEFARCALCGATDRIQALAAEQTLDLVQLTSLRWDEPRNDDGRVHTRPLAPE